LTCLPQAGVFVRKEYKDILIDSFKHCIKNKGLKIYGWCIMTSHVHMIIGTDQDKMENILRDLKRHTSEKLRSAITNNFTESRREWMLAMMTKAGTANSNNINFQFWIQNNHSVELRTIEMAHQKLDYIHYNPVEAGFVEKPEEYLYSSARDYYEGKGIIEITRLDTLIL
jgi:REP element-mobilizing transposase RayT